MGELKLSNTIVVWTRMVVFILSIAVVVISLFLYNYTPAIPIEENKVIYDMIQDRRLIAILVAAQASIFCPLFLLMSSSNTTLQVDYLQDVSKGKIWRAGFEQLCQFLMTLGLAFSWVFCVSFDKRMKTIMLEEYSVDTLCSNTNTWCNMLTYFVDTLKYVIIIALILEVLSIWFTSFQYVSLLYISQEQYSIQLSDDDDMEYNVGMESISMPEKQSIQAA